MRQADGALIADVPTPRTGGEKLPATLGALRSDLQEVLCDRVYAAGVLVRLGLSVRAIAQDAHRAYAEFTDGSTGRYDLIVGADGIRSATRALLGITTTPQPTGMSIWRVVADRPAEMECAEIYYGGPRYKAGYSPISADKCYAYILDVDGTLADFGDGPPWRLMYERSDGCGGTWGKVRETIGQDSTVSHTRIEWLLVDDPWYRGRVIVIGDAAHACPPLIAQGAAMCAEDAVVLAEVVADGHPCEAADAAAERASFGAASVGPTRSRSGTCGRSSPRLSGAWRTSRPSALTSRSSAQCRCTGTGPGRSLPSRSPP
jgi:2-polyprenyl-6-methoxyphenol hydroxylase-like FAD-dependent oxidoreductase